MNTILLQKILDILKEGLAHVGDFFKDLFVSDPQDGQVIGYDGETGEWKNMDIAELSFDITHTSGPAASISISDAAAGMPVKSLNVNIVPQQASGTPTPDNPLPISGTDEVVVTHTGKNLATATTHTIALPSTVYGGEVDVVSGKLRVTWGKYTITNDTVLSNFVPSSAYGSLARVSDIGIQAIDNSKVLTISNMAKGVSYDTRNTEPSIQRVYTDNEGYINIRASSSDNITNASVLKTLFMGAEILYMLATPIEIDLTPTTINTQGGTETFIANADTIEMEYYTATAGTIKDLVSITEDITSQVTKNTTDFSDILLKVSQNNKAVSVEIYSATTSAAVNETFLSNLPKPAMNCKVLLANTTLGEDGTILGTLKTTGELDITTSGAKTFSGLITYVVK